MRRTRFVAIATAMCLAALAGQGLAAQDTAITTADQYFLQVSERYGQIVDYEGKLAISNGKSLMSGNVMYRAPSLLRIDFVQPPGQVISFDGETLTVYVPELHAVLSQSVGAASTGSGAALASKDGLKMMRRNYSAAFESSPEPVPLEGTTGEKVVRILLTRKSVADGFRTIMVSIAPESKLIRRLEGTTLANERFIFDFTGIKINQNIPESRFIYDSPASANMYNNFLFNTEGQ